jgi:uncharacterized protein (TIGR00369 family)
MPVAGYADLMDLHLNESLKPLAHSSQNRCFGCGPANPTGLRLEFLLAGDGTAVSLPVIPKTFEGHPGFLHGGIIATLLDEAMSKAVRALGYPSVTAKIEVEFRRPVPSGVRLRLEGRIVNSEGRKHWTEAVIADSQENVLASANGLFVEIAPRTIATEAKK